MEGKLIVADAVRTANGLTGNAVFVEEGFVAAVGLNSDLARPGLSEERYPGAMITPGLRDAHFHPVAYAVALSGISLKTASNFAEIAERLRAGAGRRGSDVAVIALRLDDETLAEGRLPTRADLDAAVGDRPVLVHRYCGHIAIANSAALHAAGITGETPNPTGGLIDRDAEGRPTGVLRETAIEAVSARLAAVVRVERGEIIDALSGLAGLGITSIGAMVGLGDGPWATVVSDATIMLEAAPGLPIRVHSYLITDSGDELRRYAAAMRQPGSKLRWAGLKRFADGSLGGHTAAMHKPFSDDPDETGMLRLTAIDEELARVCLDLGGTVAIHAIGDLASTRVLDVFEKFVGEGVAGHRMRLEHASVLTPADIGRLAELGVIASVQPAFLASETTWLESRVGPERLARTYAFSSLESAGVALAGGSDCPVEPPDPWAGIALARDRAGIVPEEGLSAESAFRLFTSGGAQALGEPEPLAVGSPADFLVVDRDPVTATPDEVRATEVIDTWIAGEPVPVDRSVSTWND